MTRVCSLCKVKQAFIRSDDTLGRGASWRYVYRDDNGRRWRGSHCPNCTNRSARLKKLPKVLRRCRECNKALPITKYFHCDNHDKSRQASDPGFTQIGAY